MTTGHDILRVGLALLVAAASCSPASAQSAFFRDVVLKARASQADGVRIIAILLGHDRGDLSSDAELLRARDVLPADWHPSADLQLSKGYEAYLLVRALGLRGGAAARVMGMNKRRAFNELVYLQIMPPKGGEHAKLAGPELITLLDRANAYRDREASRGSASESKAASRPEGKHR